MHKFAFLIIQMLSFSINQFIQTGWQCQSHILIMSSSSEVGYPEIEKKVIFHFRAYEDAVLRFKNLQILRGGAPSKELTNLRDRFIFFHETSTLISDCKSHASNKVLNCAIVSANIAVGPFCSSFFKLVRQKVESFKQLFINYYILNLSSFKKHLSYLESEIAQQQELLCLLIDICIYNITINSVSFRLASIKNQLQEFDKRFEPFEINLDSMMYQVETLCKKINNLLLEEMAQKKSLYEESEEFKAMMVWRENVIKRIIKGYQIVLNCFSMQKEAIRELQMTNSNDMDDSYKIIRKVGRQKNIYSSIVLIYEKILRTVNHRQDEELKSKQTHRRTSSAGV